jgi:iron complex transport system ATP-binding protein
MVAMLLKTEHLCFAYHPENTVLHDIALTMNKGEKIFVLGPNGSGKTTLLSCLSGILSPDQGVIKLKGRDLTSYMPAERAQIIGLIPQKHVPTFPYSVEEMVMMGRAPHLRWFDLPSQLDQVIVEEVLEQLGIFELRDHPYTEISGGEQQLTRIARGLAQKCEILLMDEPTAHLDLSNQHKILEIMDQLSRLGISFVISSHQPSDALSYADRVLVLNQGWVIEDGRPQDVLTEEMISAVFGINTEILFGGEEGQRQARAVIPRRPLPVRPESLVEQGGFLYTAIEESQEKPQLLLLTGLKGFGKTSWCQKLRQLAEKEAISVSGIISPGTYSVGRKTGIEIVDISSGAKRILATLNPGKAQGLSTPRWKFDAESVMWANKVLDESPNSDLLIIDELGPLELLRGEGFLAGLEKIDTNHFRVAVVVIRSSLLPKALQRWPHAQVIRGDLEY